jgi:hypothetical protein
MGKWLQVAQMFWCRSVLALVAILCIAQSRTAAAPATGADIRPPRRIIVTFDSSGSMRDSDRARLVYYVKKFLLYGFDQKRDVGQGDALIGAVELPEFLSGPLYDPRVDEIRICTFDEKVYPIARAIGGPSDVERLFPSKFPGRSTNIAAVWDWVVDQGMTTGDTGKDVYWLFVSDDLPEGPEGKDKRQYETITRIRAQYSIETLVALSVTGEAKKKDHPAYVQIRAVSAKQFSPSDVAELTHRINAMTGLLDNALAEMHKPNAPAVADAASGDLLAQARAELKKIEWLIEKHPDLREALREPLEQIRQRLALLDGESKFSRFAGLVPLDKATLEASAAGVQFSWEESSGAVEYELICTGADNVGQTIKLKEHSRTVSLAPGVYQWRVFATGDSGRIRKEMDGGSRMLTIAAVLGGFQLKDPPAGASQLPGRVNLSWSSSAGATSYAATVTYPSGKASTFPTTTQSVDVDLADHGVYTWTVVASGSADQKPLAAIGEPRRLNIVSPPGEFELATPAAGQVVTTGDVTFTWTAASDAAQYRVDVTGPQGPRSISVSDIKAVMPFDVPGQYTWSVVAHSEKNSSVGEKTAKQSPRAIEVVRKLHQPVLREQATKLVAGSTVILEWSGDELATGYEVSVTNPEHHASSTVTRQLRYEMKVVQPGLYVWSVVALHDGSGQRVSSEPGQLLVAPIPGSPVLLQPDDNQVVKPGNVAFSWTGSSDAAGYQLIVGDAKFPTQELSVSTDLKIGVYSWKVGSIGADGKVDAWSKARKLTVLEAPVPIPTGPADSVAAGDVKLTWDPNGPDRTKFAVELFPGSADLTRDQPKLKTEVTGVFLNTQLEPGSYKWRVGTAVAADKLIFSELKAFEVVPATGSTLVVLLEVLTVGILLVLGYGWWTRPVWVQIASLDDDSSTPPKRFQMITSRRSSGVAGNKVYLGNRNNSGDRYVDAGLPGMSIRRKLTGFFLYSGDKCVRRVRMNGKFTIDSDGTKRKFVLGKGTVAKTGRKTTAKARA